MLLYYTAVSLTLERGKRGKNDTTTFTLLFTSLKKIILTSQLSLYYANRANGKVTVCHR